MLERTPLFAESWNVALREKPCGTLLDDKKTPFRILKNSLRYWAADPFLFEHEGETYIFAELYDYIRCKGGLGYCKWNNGAPTEWKQVITEPYHLSYPCIFQKGTDIFIMPESGADKSLYCYKAVHFPDQWEKAQVLRKNVVYGDTTPFCVESHRYALTYDVSNTQHYALKLLNLEDAFSKDVDVSSEDWNQQRPAGNFFYYGTQLVRPAQVCVRDYGEGLNFFACSVTDGQYQEQKIQQIMPDELTFTSACILDGMHTYNGTEKYEVIDIKTRRLNFLNLFFRFVSKIRR